MFNLARLLILALVFAVLAAAQTPSGPCTPPDSRPVLAATATQVYGCIDGQWKLLTTVASSTGLAKILSGTGAAVPATLGTDFPGWQKFSIAFLANGSGGCATATGCISVTPAGGTATLVDAAINPNTSQSVTLFQLPAGGFVEFVRIKSTTACTGTTTATATIGDTTSATKFRSTTYDLMAAVAATNVAGAAALAAPSTTAAANVVVGLAVTGSSKYISDIAAGCAFDVHIKWGVLP